MFYTIRHLTKFRYTKNISESIMETRMHPRSDSNQRCLTFHFSVSPRCRVFSYRDYLGNNVHHFDIPGVHSQLVIVAEALWRCSRPRRDAIFPGSGCLGGARCALSATATSGKCCCRANSPNPRRLLMELAASAGRLPPRRSSDARCDEINSGLYGSFEYVPRSTRVDTPIDEALTSRQGVCQDFAHIMIALLRSVGIPAVMSAVICITATRIVTVPVRTLRMPGWKAFLPQLGWAGFDPTNCLLAGERHIRTAIGRDYADVPPTKGIFRGRSASELIVAVRVTPSEAPPPLDQDLPIPEDWSILVEKAQEPPPQPGFHIGQLFQQQQQQ